ncbi:YraN family protein, partial [Patescibacteria group bacterium]|nr:YraN family protein [Patescibacteria group bacterium]
MNPYMIKQFTSYTQRLGEKGEEYAVTHLEKEGFLVVGRNIANKYGEIDIVAHKKKHYYFYEVKSGRQGGWFNPADNMSPKKIGKFLVSVEHYCLVHRIKQYTVGLLVVRLCETTIDDSTIEL